METRRGTRLQAGAGACLCRLIPTLRHVRRFLGLVIGAGFGALFVLINSGPPLGGAVTLALRVLAVVAFVALVAATVMMSRSGSGAGRQRASDTGTGPAPGLRMGRFGTGYWVVVAAEVTLLFGGLQLLRLLDAPSQTGVAWVAVVVGVHFIVFLWVWKQLSILVPGVLLTCYGLIGLMLASTSAVRWVPIVSGVLSGVTLLAGAWLVLGWEFRSVRESARSGRPRPPGDSDG